MITIEQIKEYTKCPQFGDKDYGKWGSLRLEQREAYRHLIDIIEGMEKEIERLNNIINKAIELVEKTDFNSDDNWVAKHTGEGIIGAFTIVNTLQENILKILKGEDKE